MTEQDKSEIIRLTMAVNALVTEVSDLKQKLTVSQRQSTRLRRVIKALVLVVVVAMVAVVFSIRASGEVGSSQLRNCQNSNESRNAAYSLWDFIINLYTESPMLPAKDRANLESIRSWVGQVYAERDCSDLTKKYPLPAPPALQ